MRKVLTLTACGVLMLLGAACEPMEAKPYNPQSPSREHRTEQSCSEAVAKVMGIPWTVENGATEKLGEFNKRVKECLDG